MPPWPLPATLPPLARMLRPRGTALRGQTVLPGPDGGAAGALDCHLRFGSVPGGGDCSPAVGAAPRSPPASARRLCSLHSNFSSCKRPARSLPEQVSEEPPLRAHGSHPRGAESRGLGYATGAPTTAEAVGQPRGEEPGERQVDDRPRAAGGDAPHPAPPLPSAQPRGTGPERRCAWR